MIDADSDPDPMLELFRSEVRDQTDALARGLFALEGDPANLTPVPDLTIAVSAVRGAAKIVGRGDVATFAGALEGFFAAVEAGRIALSGKDVALGQRAVDALRQSEFADPSLWSADASGIAREIEARLAGNPAESRSPVGAPPAPTSVAPTPQPPPPPAIPAANDPLPTLPPIDPAMLELFREEVRSHASSLSSGLVDLERDPANPQRIEPLMRAAHSLKGACRIVGLDLAVALAHDTEDGFVAAQAGKIRITPAAIDTFLRVADVLAALAEEEPIRWVAKYRAEVAQLLQQVGTVNRGETPTSPAISAEPEVAPDIVVSPPPTVPEAAGKGATATTEQPVLVDVAGTHTPTHAEPAESVVRVTAQSLNRLMSLAGESLVQARWLQPFATAMLELKKLQDHIAARLDTLAHGIATGQPADALAPVAADARRLSGKCRQVLGERISEFEEHAGQAEDLNSRLYREVIVSRMRPFSDGAHGLPRLARDTARRLGKAVRLDVVGQSTEVDRDILEKLEAPLTHLVRNAIDHGLESPEVRASAGKLAEGVVRIEARHRGGMLSIAVSDDGGGIDVEKLRKKIVSQGRSTADAASRMSDAELLEFLFLPGFSTASQVTEVSGRGVGLDVVQDIVRKVGGSVQISTHLGRGTTFHMLLPLTLSVVRAVLVDIAGEPYAFPHNRIDRLVRVPRSEVSSLQHRQFVNVDGRNVGLVLASQLLDLPGEPPAGGELPVLLLSDVSGTYGLIVEAFRGEQDLVVRPLDPRLGKVPNVSAAAILDDGSPVLIADVEDLVRSMDRFIQTGTLRRCDAAPLRTAAKKRILVVDDSITVREVQKQILRGRGYDVEVAFDGQDGWNRVRAESFDLVVSDVDMPRMTGLEFVRKIREDQRLRELPVVIVSYKDREEDRLRGLDAGANHYLTKSSFQDDSFVEAVSALIGPA